MSFLVTVLWAFLSFANPGMGQPLDLGAPSVSAGAPVHGLHHSKGGLHAMDTAVGGPT